VSEWVALMTLIQAESGRYRLGSPTRRLFESLSRVPENGCRVARDPVFARIRPPPDGMFHARSFDGASENRYELMTQTAEYGLPEPIERAIWP